MLLFINKRCFFCKALRKVIIYVELQRPIYVLLHKIKRCRKAIEKTWKSKEAKLVFPVCKFLKTVCKAFLILTSLNPFGINLNPLDALLQSPCN